MNNIGSKTRHRLCNFNLQAAFAIDNGPCRTVIIQIGVCAAPFDRLRRVKPRAAADFITNFKFFVPKTHERVISVSAASFGWATTGRPCIFERFKKRLGPVRSKSYLTGGRYGGRFDNLVRM
jgi:hypothetical protein